MVGIPGESLGDVVLDAGAIHALYSGLGAPGSAGDAVWHQDQPGILGSAEDGDAFGSSLACGDFDNDGAEDLAVGIAFENLGTWPSCGSAQVLYGTPGILFDDFESGTTSAWSQTVP